MAIYPLNALFSSRHFFQLIFSVEKKVSFACNGFSRLVFWDGCLAEILFLTPIPLAFILKIGLPKGFGEWEIPQRYRCGAGLTPWLVLMTDWKEMHKKQAMPRLFFGDLPAYFGGGQVDKKRRDR